MRAISVAFSPARPSRLKNEPGILPAAYIRSSTSTVSGMKSMSRRLPAVAVERTSVSPEATRTAPEACLARRPVSNTISAPPISTETSCTSAMCSFLARRSVCGGRILHSNRFGSEAAFMVAAAREGTRRDAPAHRALRRHRLHRAPDRRAARRPRRAAAAGRALGGAARARWPSASAARVAAGRRLPAATRSSTLVEAGDVLLTTVGPFAKWGEPAVRAAIAAPRGLPRLDRRAGRSSGACSRSAARPRRGRARR